MKKPFKKKVGYLGIDQYKNMYYMKEFPRKELLKQLDASKARKLYIDEILNRPKQVGYIIKGLFIEIYEIHEWEIKNKFVNY